MKVTCTGRRVTLKPSFIENAEKRLAKLDKFFPDEAQAQVTVTVEKSGQTVEIMLRSKDLAMRAEKTDERMEDALADAVDLLTRRLVDHLIVAAAHAGVAQCDLAFVPVYDT